jgi:hypothetical protein
MIHALGILEANALMLLLGCFLLPLLGFRSRPLVDRLLLAYAVGLATGGVLAATLALVFIPLDAPVLFVAVVCAFAAWWRWGRHERSSATVPALDAVSALVLAVPVLLLARAVALFAVRPLHEFDGWVIWATRARALYEFSGPAAPVFTDPTYPALQHPLLLPALEATDAHFMGAWDGTVMHLQLLGFAIAFVGGTWALLRPYVWQPLLAGVLAAVVAAPAVLDQLATNYADVPLALFVALGVAPIALWMTYGERELLVASALFLGAAALTKNEGELFAVCALAAAAATGGRRRLRPIAITAAAVAAIDAPWRIWIATHHVKISEYSISNAFDPGFLRARWSRVGPSAHELLTQIVRVQAWGYLVALALVGVAGAFVVRAPRRGAFVSLWLLLSFAGMVVIYWISTNPVTNNLYNSSNRTVDAIVVGAAAAVPALLAPVEAMGSSRGRVERREPEETTR